MDKLAQFSGPDPSSHHPSAALAPGIAESRKWFVLFGLFGAGWVLYLLGPVLAPFLIAAVLAYLGDPLVDRLEAMRLSRTVSVLIVFALLTLAGLLLVLVLVPVLQQQVQTLIANLPVAAEWVQRHLLPQLLGWALGKDAKIDVAALRSAVGSHWQELAGALTGIIRQITLSSQVLLAWIMGAVLVPIVTFYLLRDWDVLLAHIHDLLPRRYEGTLVGLARECDEVLSGFLRGQLLVMLALMMIYAFGLWLVGLDLAFSIGLLAGLVSFVPYLGFIVGISAAGLAAMVQFQDMFYLLYVGMVFGVAEGIQGLVLSPWLVGGRIGLHPVAVIFAVLAGGQLFGFVGVLLGLPAAAVMVVLLRHSRELYFTSDLYEP